MSVSKYAVTLNKQIPRGWSGMKMAGAGQVTKYYIIIFLPCWMQLVILPTPCIVQRMTKNTTMMIIIWLLLFVNNSYINLFQ